MATVSTFNYVNEANIGAINNVAAGNIASINHISFSAGSADTVSLDYYSLEFDGFGDPIVTSIVTVTSSQNWLTSLIDTGYGTSWLSRTPTSGSTGQTCTIIVDGGYSGAGRGATVRFAAGTADADLQIWQYGT